MRCVLVCAHANIFFFGKRTKIIFEWRRTDWNVVTIFMPSFGFSDRPTIVSNKLQLESAPSPLLFLFLFLFCRCSMHAWHENWLHSFIGNFVFSLFHIIVIVDSILPLDCVLFVKYILYVSFSNHIHTMTMAIFMAKSLPISFCVHVHVLECRFTNPETKRT